MNALANEGRWQVYGSGMSYFTGKLEAVLRFMEHFRRMQQRL